MTVKECCELSMAEVGEMQRSKKSGREILQMVGTRVQKLQRTPCPLRATSLLRGRCAEALSSLPVGFSSLLGHCKCTYTLWPCKIFTFLQVTAGLVFIVLETPNRLDHKQLLLVFTKREIFSVYCSCGYWVLALEAQLPWTYFSKMTFFSVHVCLPVWLQIVG